MKLQQFSGGLNTRQASHLIGIDEAVEYENIDNESGELKPCKALLKGTTIYNERDRHITHLDAIINLAKIPIDYVEYQERIYYSVLDDFIQMKDVQGDIPTEGDLGFVAPVLNSVEIIIDQPVTPIDENISVVEKSLASWIFTQWGYYANGEFYDFAFIKLDNQGNRSDTFFKTIQISGLINSGFKALEFTLPYDYEIYLERGGVWKGIKGWVITASSSDPFITYFEIGKANIAHQVTPTAFDVTAVETEEELIGRTDVWYSYETDIDLLDLSVTTAGTYTYAATVVSSILGWESEPSNLLSAVIVAGEQVKLIVDFSETIPGDPIPIVDSRIDGINIYRLGDTITDFTLLQTITDLTAPITFVDREPNVSISGNKILDTEDYDKPLSGIKNLVVANGQLIGTLGSKLYFTLIGKLFAMPPFNFRDFKEEIKGIFDIDAGLIICSATKTWLLNTSDLATGKTLKLSSEFGCSGHLTMGGISTGAIWASNVGFCSSFGGNVELLTKDKLGFGDLNIVKSIVYNETYFGFTINGTCYALDLRYEDSIKFFNFKLFDDNDTNTIIRQIYLDGTKLKILFGTIISINEYEVFGATIVEDLIWKSPKFIEGAYTDLKTYKDIYIYATKDITFETYIDDLLVNKTIINKTDNHHIKVDQSKHQGYSIRFEAIGKGTISEIEYKVMGSQDGR